MRIYLFDLDGTLVDSMPAFIRCVLGILEETGTSYEGDVIRAVTPLGVQGTADYFVKIGVPLSREEIIRRIGVHLLDEYTNRIPAKTHVREVLELLHQQGSRLFVLSASPHIVLDPCLRRLGLYDRFEAVWSCDDFGLKKDDERIYHCTAERMGAPESEILFLDDHCDAVRAAKAAGLRVCGVYDASSAEYEQEIRATADFYIRDFDELRQRGF